MKAVFILALLAAVATAHVIPVSTVYPQVTYAKPAVQYQYVHTKVPQYQYVYNPVQYNKVPLYTYPYGYNYGTTYYNTPYVYGL